MTGTKIVLTNEYGEYSVSSVNPDLNLDGIVEFLIIPMLLAAGYSQETIDICLK